jgi:hypothetical protein
MEALHKKWCILVIWILYSATCVCILFRSHSEFCNGFISSLSIPVLYSILAYKWFYLGDIGTHKMGRVKNDTFIIGLGFLFFSFASLVINSSNSYQGTLWPFTMIFFGLYGLFTGFLFSIINIRFNYQKEYSLFFAYLFFFILLLCFESYEMTYIKTVVQKTGYLFLLNSVVSSILMILFLYSILFRKGNRPVY